MPLQLKLPNFEGPLDVLLHLLREQKIDIYDIPIAQITQQYLAFLEKMQAANFELAGEYFVMASTLLKIKSQLLLPHNDYVAEEATEDSRQQLVEQLVQYEIFQNIAAYLKKQGQQVPLLAAKPATVAGKSQRLPLGQVRLTDLVAAMSQLTTRYQLRQPNAGRLQLRRTSVGTMRTVLKTALPKQGSAKFSRLLQKTAPDLDTAVALFLAALDLCRQRVIFLKQTKGDIIVRWLDQDE